MRNVAAGDFHILAVKLLHFPVFFLVKLVDHLQLVLLYAHIVFAVCAFPYILAFTTDSIEIRLVVNGNLVYTAVVPELQLAASRVSMTANTI